VEPKTHCVNAGLKTNGQATATTAAASNVVPKKATKPTPTAAPIVSKASSVPNTPRARTWVNRTFGCSYCCSGGSTSTFTSFASDLLDLQVIQLHRRRAAEDRHHGLELGLGVVDLLDDAHEVPERPLDDADVLALLELHGGAGLALGGGLRQIDD